MPLMKNGNIGHWNAYVFFSKYTPWYRLCSASSGKIFTQSQKQSFSSSQVYFALSKETQDKGIDSDFGELFGSSDPGNSLPVKSRFVYIIKFGNVPILWVSKPQTQIALSKMESE